MKVLKTKEYIKLAGKKKKEWDPNPWAVCHTTVNKDEDPEKFERCVKKVKKKQTSSGIEIKKSEKEKKWIQKAVPESHEGKFGEWCKRNGFSGVCQECINKAVSAGGHAAKMANFAINVSKGKYHHPNK